MRKYAMSLSANTKIVAKVEKRFRLFYAYREIVLVYKDGYIGIA